MDEDTKGLKNYEQTGDLCEQFSVVAISHAITSQLHEDPDHQGRRWCKSGAAEDSWTAS